MENPLTSSITKNEHFQEYKNQPEKIQKFYDNNDKAEIFQELNNNNIKKQIITHNLTDSPNINE